MRCVSCCQTKAQAPAPETASVSATATPAIAEMNSEAASHWNFSCCRSDEAGISVSPIMIGASANTARIANSLGS